MQIQGLHWLSVLFVPLCYGTWRYYNTYISYGSGDTIIQNTHGHGGSNAKNVKWNVECLDGEAMIGLTDWVDDFERLVATWCKFMFPYKPPANGRYPYFPGCHVRNITDQFFCYNPLEPEKTVNTFVTGMWSNHLLWFIYRPGTDDIQPMKCCKTPPGYYIDYMSCYYVSTHDHNLEYYDNLNFINVACGMGHIVTGIAKKLNPYTKEYHMDWLQCCRVGYGPARALPPPVTYAPSGVPTYYSSRSEGVIPISDGYISQYRSQETNSTKREDGFSEHGDKLMETKEEILGNRRHSELMFIRSRDADGRFSRTR